MNIANVDFSLGQKNYSVIERKIRKLQQIGEQQSKHVRELLLTQTTPKGQINAFKQFREAQVVEKRAPAKKRYRCQDYMQRHRDKQQAYNNLPLNREKMKLVEDYSPQQQRPFDQQLEYLKSEEYKQYLQSLLRTPSARIMQTNHSLHQQKTFTNNRRPFQENLNRVLGSTKTIKQEQSGRQQKYFRRKGKAVYNEVSQQSQNALQVQRNYLLTNPLKSMPTTPKHPPSLHQPVLYCTNAYVETHNNNLVHYYDEKTNRNKGKPQPSTVQTINYGGKENQCKYDQQGGYQLFHFQEQFNKIKISFKIEKPNYRGPSSNVQSKGIKKGYRGWEQRCNTETQQSLESSVLGKNDGFKGSKNPKKLSLVSRSKAKRK